MYGKFNLYGMMEKYRLWKIWKILNLNFNFDIE